MKKDWKDLRIGELVDLANESINYKARGIVIKNEQYHRPGINILLIHGGQVFIPETAISQWSFEKVTKVVI